ncbi:MAG: Phosphoenolpyruvate carboxykinase (GTP) [Candidatus Hydrogenedentes bacterium ADurb.Bin179]|nr:MAG: Phosphoenolpyruvate carboxykinase (GTP) [Candidatus Hydrogenedentes bacterium ADurb.Bin179]
MLYDGEPLTTNNILRNWIEEMAALCLPDKIIWIDGSDVQRELLIAEAIRIGEIIALNPEKHPNSYYHRTHPLDVARSEDKTFICCQREQDAGKTNNWKNPEEAYFEAANFFRGSMHGRTMYVVPFSMGPIGSPFSKIGIELTDSLYVVLNMMIMCRVGKKVLDSLGQSNEFTRCLHSKANLDPDCRRILHFPEDNTVWSVNSGYGGNVLLGKKCLALRMASCMARKEGWLAEHMLILGVEEPNGHIDYVAAAFPSACGKTNLAMLIPPEGLKCKGYRIWTVGDDIAWIRPDTDGRLWAINPEAGFFGVAPGTNSTSNRNAMLTVQKNTIFTNVVLGNDKTVWWEEGDGEPPEEALDWLGRPWKRGMTDKEGKEILGAHPNSRFTAPLQQCPSASHRLEHHHGVPIAAFIFGGRRDRLTPLVYEAYSWNHGVFVGASMASERTSAQYGKQGEVRRDPFAMLPFCGYNMADYFKHWINIGRSINRPPKVFHVNWFRKDKNNKFLWPGYGENLRVLEWIIQRSRGEGAATETPIGYVPTSEALDMTGLELKAGILDKLLHVDAKEWLAESDDIEKFFDSLGPRVPWELRNELEALRNRFAESEK